MVDPDQLEALKDWLRAHKDRLKFVISSVPFLADLRDAEDGLDKWSGGAFRQQRDDVVEWLCTWGIDKVIFLVGDMHCSYHATMQLGAPAERLTLHELAGGPINQLQFTSRADFLPQVRGVTLGPLKKEFTTSLRRVHGASSSVLQVTAEPGRSEVLWEVVPTSAGWEASAEAERPTLNGRISFGGPE